jgi:hypothetical protein
MTLAMDTTWLAALPQTELARALAIGFSAAKATKFKFALTRKTKLHRAFPIERSE